MRLVSYGQYALLVSMLIGTGLVVSSKCDAQLGLVGAQSTIINPSARMSGMGQTGTGIFWGDVNEWANPAVLPYNQYVLYEWSRTELVPDLSNDVVFTSNRIGWGGGGIGIVLAGQRLDV